MAFVALGVLAVGLATEKFFLSLIYGGTIILTSVWLGFAFVLSYEMFGLVAFGVINSLVNCS